MEKVVDLSRTIHDICADYPDAADIMEKLGFSDIMKPGMRQTVGRFMTIPKGAAMKGINLERIKETFKKNGFEVL